MLIWLWSWLHHQPTQDVYQNTLLIRTILCALTSLAMSLFLGKKSIALLQKLQLGQVVRDDGPQSHIQKTGTPTMGGILILLSIVVSCLLWGNWFNPLLWLCLGILTFIGFLGWYDDWRKMVLKNPKGLSGKMKLLWQTVAALVVAGVLWMLDQHHGLLTIPAFHLNWEIGLWAIPVAWFVIVGGSNSVNLTDGQDGLVIFPVLLCAAALGLIAWFSHQSHTAAQFHLLFQPHAGDVLLICAAIVGASIGFLWFNAFPAQVFMGDVGALSLGAVLATIAIVLHQEIAFGIMGGIFVLEAVSVILQVGSYKLRKKRIFRMAPIHHHFELGGTPESKVTVRFWLVSLVLTVVALVLVL